MHRFQINNWKQCIRLLITQVLRIQCNNRIIQHHININLNRHLHVEINLTAVLNCQLEHVQILMTVTVIQDKMWSTDWLTDLLYYKGTIKIVSNKLKSKGAFLWDGPDQDEHSKITQKWNINKRNLWILQCSLEWIQGNFNPLMQHDLRDFGSLIPKDYTL